VQICLEDLSTEDLMRTFDSLPLDYKLSIPYVARITVIHGQEDVLFHKHLLDPLISIFNIFTLKVRPIIRCSWSGLSPQAINRKCKSRGKCDSPSAYDAADHAARITLLKSTRYKKTVRDGGLISTDDSKFKSSVRTKRTAVLLIVLKEEKEVFQFKHIVMYFF
jgi:hypothetical protein